MTKTAAITTAVGALARELSRGVSAHDLSEILEILRAALEDEVDGRIADIIEEASGALDELQATLDNEACECPWESVRPDMISPPERLIGRNRDCPVHGRDPDHERDKRIDDRLTGDL